jgi:AAA family ATP:ADP antiporter
VTEVAGEAPTGPPSSAASDDRTWLERSLSPIAEIRHGEVTGALLMTALMFVVLAAYYELKTAREIFILSEGGAAVKSYSSAGQALLLLFIVPAYGAFASRVDRLRLVRGVTLFFVANLALFAVALQVGLHIGIPFFLWLGIFNLMVIAQFWAFAADIYTQEQGKRIFPLVGVGSSLGAWVGSMRAGQLVESHGAMRLLLGGAGLLVVCVVLVTLIHRVAARDKAPASTTHEPVRGDEPLAGDGGFTLIRKDRYLMLIAALMVVLNVVNTSGEYLFGRYVVEQANAQFSDPAARQRFIGETYSHLFSTVNLLGFLLQMFVVSRVFKFLGVGRSLFIHPMVALTGYVLMMRTPSVQLMSTLKIADNSIDYSLGNTTKQALWLPTSREAKYKAKQAVDSFFVRMGDVIQAGVVFLGERVAMAIPAFAAVNVALSAVWLGVVVLLNSALRARAGDTRAHL